MGFFDRYTTNPTYLGVTPGELGSDVEEVVRRLTTYLASQEPIVGAIGPMVICRSPVLVFQHGELRQPASVVPRQVMSRFWHAPGSGFFADRKTVPLVANHARALASNDALARKVLADTENVWVSDEAPTTKWPDQDKRLRIASLVLADVVRKLAAKFSAADIQGSYDLTATSSAAVERMHAEEEPWFTAALTAR
jgi:hypothetical protein